MRRGGAVGTIGVNLMQNSSAAAKGEISRILRASRGTFVATWIFSALVNILMLTGPLFMLQVYDRVLTSRSVPTLLALSAIVVVLYAYYGFLEFVRSRILIRISRRIDEKLRDRAFDTVVTHALRRTPNFGNQPVNDLATIRQYLGGQGPFAFLDMPWVPVYLAVIFLMHWVLGVAALAAAALIFVLAILTEQSTRKPLAEATSALARATVMTDESRRNSEALQALGMRERMRERWDVLQQDLERLVPRHPSGHPVRCAGAWRLSGHPAGDIAGLDDCGVHHHVPGAGTGGAGGGKLAAVPGFPQGHGTPVTRPAIGSTGTGTHEAAETGRAA
jgi:ABC-type protease/lipase transport system fused ATPase/permease subunit